MPATRPATSTSPSRLRRLVSAAVLTLLVVAAVVLALSDAPDLLVVIVSLAAALALVNLAGIIDSARPIGRTSNDRTAR